LNFPQFSFSTLKYPTTGGSLLSALQLPAAVLSLPAADVAAALATLRGLGLELPPVLAPRALRNPVEGLRPNSKLGASLQTLDSSRIS